MARKKKTKPSAIYGSSPSVRWAAEKKKKKVVYTYRKKA